MVSSIAGDMKHQSSQTHQYNLQPQRILKKPLNSLPSGPQQPKVYKVKPIHFRELVQKLTGAPLQPQTRRSSLQSVAPPPLPLHPHQLRVQNQTQTQTSIVKQEVVPYKVDQALLPASAEQQKSFLYKMEDGDGLTELTLSPNFQSWFAFAMLSPGAATVSQLEQRSAV